MKLDESIHYPYNLHILRFTLFDRSLAYDIFINDLPWLRDLAREKLGRLIQTGDSCLSTCLLVDLIVTGKVTKPKEETNEIFTLVVHCSGGSSLLVSCHLKVNRCNLVKL